MPSTREVRRRIRSVKNMAQITKAMQMVASSKMRRAQERVEDARPYADQISGARLAPRQRRRRRYRRRRHAIEKTSCAHYWHYCCNTGPWTMRRIAQQYQSQGRTHCTRGVR